MEDLLKDDMAGLGEEGVLVFEEQRRIWMFLPRVIRCSGGGVCRRPGVFDDVDIL